MEIREFNSGDSADICHIWHEVFGDGEAFVLDFLQNVLLPSRGFVAVKDGTAIAAAFIIDGILACDVAYPYIYAVSTLAEHRGAGLGRKLSVACAEMIKREGGIASLHPAESSLFSWYGKMGFSPICTVREAEISVSATADFVLKKADSEEFNAARNAILDGTKSARFSTKLIDWQASFGMEYYVFDGGCLAAYFDGARIVVPELLAKNNAKSALDALAHIHSCDSCFVRTPNLSHFEGFGEPVEFVSAFGSDIQLDHWGFVFD